MYKRVFFFTIFILTFLYFLLPIFLEASFTPFIDLLTNYDGFFSSIKNSLVFALSTTVLLIPIAFIFGLYLTKSRAKTPKNIFIIPFTFGSIGTAYIFKILFFNSEFQHFILDSNLLIQLIFGFSLQFWQLGFLFTYLFYINFLSVSRDNLDFYSSQKIPYKYLVKDVYFQKLKSLTIVLSLITFIFTFYEDAKSQLILKASRGMSNELVNHWLYRRFNSDLLVSFQNAQENLFSSSVFIVFMLLLILSILIFTINYSSFFLKHLHFNNNISRILIPTKVKEKVTLFTSLVIIISVILFPLLDLDINLLKDTLVLSKSFIIIFVVSFGVLIIVNLFLIALKLTFYKQFSNSNRLLYFILFSFYFILLLPPMSLVINNYRWINSLLNTDFSIYFSFFLAHLVLLFPIIGSFIFALFFTVKEEVIEYHKIYQIGTKSIVKYLFLKKFKYEYLLLLFLTFSMIWNDKIINIVFSEQIPSFAQRLELSLIGRGADYQISLMYYIVVLIINILIFVLWSSLSKKYLIRYD